MSNNNPTGINQYPGCSKPGDREVEEWIRGYHHDGITDRKTISRLLWADHACRMSDTTVACHLCDLGLKAAGIATKALTPEERRQLVLNQMAVDPNHRQGPASVKEGIARKTGVHLTHECIRKEMHLQDPDGFALREPSTKTIKWGVLVSLGPHHEWSADGHDKLSKIGFPIWGVRDQWSGKWLGLWVLPNNRLNVSIAYLYLKLVAELGGMPIQSTTDCGSETTFMYGLASALRDFFSPELSEAGHSAAHAFLKSIYNITIECGWLRLHLSWGDNVKTFWDAGSGIYNSSIPKQ